MDLLQIKKDFEDGKPISYADFGRIYPVNLCGENVRNDKMLLECFDGLGWNEDEDEEEDGDYD